MRRLKHGLVLMFVAVLLIGPGSFVQPSRARTATVTATIKFSDSAVVNKSSSIGFAPLPTAPGFAFLFMDSYGNTWAQKGDELEGAQGQPGAITIANSSDQFMNFLTGNLQSNMDIEALKVVCSMHTSLDRSCSQLLAPGNGKDKTIYLGMNMMVKDHGDKNPDGSMLLADASPSIDITVVYQ